MSDKTENPTVLDEHGDELIHVPEGKSRLRYLATIALVLFLLVIFVVADLFQSSMTGGGRSERGSETYLTWKDPVDETAHQVSRTEFFDTARFLSDMSVFGMYRPDSLLFGESTERRRNNEPEEEDVASFLVYEKVALASGIAVADDEVKDTMRSLFGTNEMFAAQADRAGKSRAEVMAGARRILRVNKLRGLMLQTVGIPDPNAIVTAWQESRPEFKFQALTVNRDDFVATAETELPDDATLTDWFHARPDFEQRKLYTEERVVANVAYVPMDGAFDAAKLTEAYPATEGLDLDAQAQSYFSQFRALRFKVEEPAEEEPKEEDSDAQDPKKLFYDFEEVEDRVRVEAPIHAALSNFLIDVQDRVDAGEEVDLAAEAERLGLTYVAGDEAGMTRAELSETPIWGGPQISGQLSFGAIGAFTSRVGATADALVLGQVVSNVDPVEPAFEDIREDVAKMWSEERAGELAVETMENVRAVLATKPEDVETADWNPVIGWDELKKLAGEANYAVYDRPWLERNSFPDGKTFQTADAADKHLMLTPALYELEAGQVAPAAKSSDGTQAFLIRFDGQRDKDPSEIDAGTVLQMRQSEAFTRQRDFGAKVFLGDGSWLKERAAIAFPAKEAEEAERAKEDKTAG